MDRFLPLLAAPFVQPLNAQLKGAASAAISALLEPSAPLDAPSSHSLPAQRSLSTIDAIIQAYNRWTAHSPEKERFVLYLMTGRGFFRLHLVQCRIAQAVPCTRPELSPPQLDIYNHMLQDLRTATKNETALWRFQLNCLLHMLLGDLRVLLRARSRPPDFFRTLVGQLRAFAPTAVAESERLKELEECLRLTEADARQLHTALLAHCDLFFVAQRDERAHEDSLGQLGMIFTRTVGDRLSIFAVAEDPASEPLPVAGGQWALGLRIRYTIHVG
jgi:hypothetical protein